MQGEMQKCARMKFAAGALYNPAYDAETYA
jgi:hypothetical protein